MRASACSAVRSAAVAVAAGRSNRIRPSRRPRASSSPSITPISASASIACTSAVGGPAVARAHGGQLRSCSACWALLSAWIWNRRARPGLHLRDPVLRVVDGAQHQLAAEHRDEAVQPAVVQRRARSGSRAGRRAPVPGGSRRAATARAAPAPTLRSIANGCPAPSPLSVQIAAAQDRRRRRLAHRRRVDRPARLARGVQRRAPSTGRRPACAARARDRAPSRSRRARARAGPTAGSSFSRCVASPVIHGSSRYANRSRQPAQVAGEPSQPGAVSRNARPWRSSSSAAASGSCAAVSVWIDARSAGSTSSARAAACACARARRCRGCRPAPARGTGRERAAADQDADRRRRLREQDRVARAARRAAWPAAGRRSTRSARMSSKVAVRRKAMSAARARPGQRRLRARCESRGREDVGSRVPARSPGRSAVAARRARARRGAAGRSRARSATDAVARRTRRRTPAGRGARRRAAACAGSRAAAPRRRRPAPAAGRRRARRRQTSRRKLQALREAAWRAGEVERHRRQQPVRLAADPQRRQRALRAHAVDEVGARRSSVGGRPVRSGRVTICSRYVRRR